MNNQFHYDPAVYREQVAHIAERVVSNDDAILTFVPRIAFDSNSYHAAAIEKAKEDQIDRMNPRFHR